MKIPKWVKILMLVQISLLIFLTYSVLKKQPIINNYIEKVDPSLLATPKDGYTPVKGVDYFDGNDAVVDYSIINSYIDAKIEALPKPQDGKDGYTPVKGVDYFDGENGQEGTSASNIELRCVDFINKLSQVQYKHENVFTWIRLYDIPHKCEVQ